MQQPCFQIERIRVMHRRCMLQESSNRSSLGLPCSHVDKHDDTGSSWHPCMHSANDPALMGGCAHRDMSPSMNKAINKASVDGPRVCRYNPVKRWWPGPSPSINKAINKASVDGPRPVPINQQSKCRCVLARPNQSIKQSTEQV